MAYTVASLLTLFRSEVDDTATPYLWSDTEFFQYLNEAQKEFARETRCFKDSVTKSVCESRVRANISYADIDERIIDIRRAQLASASKPLSVYNMNEMDAAFVQGDYGNELAVDWTTSTGTPRIIIKDVTKDKVQLVPQPTVDDTLKMWVIRLPLDEILSDKSSLEISESTHQLLLLDYVKFRAYSKNDADTYDPDQASKYEGAFYGKLRTMVKPEFAKKTRRPATVRYGGI